MIKPLSHHTLLEGVQALANRDQDLARIVSTYGPPPLWARAQGFPTLVQIILEQQVSLASAKAAYTRLEEAVHPLTPENLLTLTDDRLKQIGFSRQKTKYARELSNAILNGSLDLSALAQLKDEAVKECLMKVKGIGPWTAEIYLLMALGRPDIWPNGDLGLELAIQQVKALEKRPTREEASAISNAWQPWRAVAARMLWHAYLSVRNNNAS